MISIHALRGEGDAKPYKKQQMTRYFNPRPPWGGRHDAEVTKKILENISIHALRGEGDCKAEVKDKTDLKISIHALRGEGDSSPPSYISRTATFQSTPSVGRATAI